MARKKTTPKTKRNLYYDIGIAGALLITLAPDITGLTIHEWLGVAFGGMLLVHLLLHWKWVVAMTKRFFGPMPLKARINYLLSIALLGAFALVGLTGMLGSDTFGMGGGEFLEEAHEAFSQLSLLLVGTHLAMHWRWIVKAVQRYILRKKPGAQTNKKLAPAPVRVK